MTRRLLDQDRRREQRRQGVLLDRLESRFRGRVRTALTAAIGDMLDGYEITGDVPPVRDLRDRMEAIYRQMAETSIRMFGMRVLDQGKAAGHVLETKGFAETLAQLSQEYITQEAIRRRITDVVETTRAQIVRGVAAGYADGLGQREVARRVRESVPTLTSFRANMIARTETHGAANYGANAAAIETGLQLRKEWVAASDERTRQDHADADGQTVAMDESFDVGGEALDYPGDPGGSAEQVINCRCSISHIVVE